MRQAESDKPLVADGAGTAWAVLGSLIGDAVRWWVMVGVGR